MLIFLRVLQGVWERVHINQREIEMVLTYLGTIWSDCSKYLIIQWCPHKLWRNNLIPMISIISQLHFIWDIMNKNMWPFTVASTKNTQLYSRDSSAMLERRNEHTLTRKWQRFTVKSIWYFFFLKLLKYMKEQWCQWYYYDLTKKERYLGEDTKEPCGHLKSEKLPCSILNTCTELVDRMQDL